ncbi:T9SS type A sorting domain-containing protein [Chryseobacterium sp. CT-SW4]|uniref:T9SS type A sorting domain-containing protein n=1 Tax=Chryseobacterium sp. SW-1 TaxID=3157343 RepID=UPI003B01E629
MKKTYFLAFAFASFFAVGQVSLTSLGTAYLEDFDSMGNTTTLPAGWSAVRASGSGTPGQSLTPTVTDGTANSGGVYNVGTNGSSDRALGTIASGSTVPALGAQFVNNTEDAIASVAISFTEEQWRSASNAVVETVAFSYSTDATSLTSGTWTTVTPLDLVEILTSSSSSVPVNGNSEANRINKSYTISGLDIPVGQSLFIKWADKNETGSDGLYAVDDFSLTPTGRSLAVKDIQKSKTDFVRNTFVQHGEIIFGPGVSTIRIYDNLGKIVKESALKVNKKLNISELPKGNYLVTGIINNNPVSQKILKD